MTSTAWRKILDRNTNYLNYCRGLQNKLRKWRHTSLQRAQKIASQEQHCAVLWYEMGRDLKDGQTIFSEVSTGCSMKSLMNGYLLMHVHRKRNCDKRRIIQMRSTQRNGVEGYWATAQNKFHLNARNRMEDKTWSGAPAKRKADGQGNGKDKRSKDHQTRDFSSQFSWVSIPDLSGLLPHLCCSFFFSFWRLVFEFIFLVRFAVPVLLILEQHLRCGGARGPFLRLKRKS